MAAPPVRIESMAWTDHRYTALALALGMADRDLALIKVATIWRWQTEHYTAEAPTYAVPRSVVIGALGSLRAPEAMIEADLAELEPDGRLRIRGGRDANGKSRIDWLWVEREQRRAAGEASAKRRKAAGDPRARAGKFGDLSTGDQRATNETATNAERSTERPPSSLISDLRTPDLRSPSQERAREEVGDVAPPAPPAPPALGQLVDHAIDRLNAARRKVDRDAPPIPLIADQPCRDLLDHLRLVPEPDRRPTLDRAIDVMVATLTADGRPVGEYRMAMLSGPRSWPRWRDGTATSARGRDGPAGRPAATSRTRLTGLAASLAEE